MLFMLHYFLIFNKISFKSIPSRNINNLIKFFSYLLLNDLIFLILEPFLKIGEIKTSNVFIIFLLMKDLEIDKTDIENEKLFFINNVQNECQQV